MATAAGASCLNTVGAYRCGEVIVQQFSILYLSLRFDGIDCLFLNTSIQSFSLLRSQCPLGFINDQRLDNDGRLNGSRCLLPPPPAPAPGQDMAAAGTGAGAQATVEPTIPMGLVVPRNADPEAIVATLRQDLAASLEIDVDECRVTYTVGGAAGRRQLAAASHRRRAQMIDLACIISIDSDSPTGNMVCHSAPCHRSEIISVTVTTTGNFDRAQRANGRPGEPDGAFFSARKHSASNPMAAC